MFLIATRGSLVTGFVALLPVTFAALATASLGGCGARTGMAGLEVDASVPVTIDAGPRPACTADSDCKGFDDKCALARCTGGACVKDAPIVCNDNDPCTADVCTPATGTCAFTPRSLDLDHDGHRGPIPGTVPGAPDSCGDDCDDTNSAAFPGGIELCDGVDNDCNGVVDDHARYVPVNGAPTRVSSSAFTVAGPDGLANNGDTFIALYDGDQAGKNRVFAQNVTVDGALRPPETRLTNVESDAAGASIAWTGDRFGVAWSDRRDSNYEVYFATFDRTGHKLAPGDVRITETEGFSINVSLVWTGAEFVIAWQEDTGNATQYRIVGQRVALDGTRLGDNVALSTPTTQTLSAESPTLAVGRPNLGVAWVENRGTNGNGLGNQIAFAPFTFDLKSAGATALLTSTKQTGISPRVVWNQTSFAVAWYENDPVKRTVWGAVVDGAGKPTGVSKLLTDSPRQARDPALVPLGDRVLLVYADSRDQNSGYELYTRMLGPTLDATLAPQRITTSTGDSVFPITGFGPKGEIGVLFRDDVQQSPQVYFTHLECRAN